MWTEYTQGWRKCSCSASYWSQNSDNVSEERYCMESRGSLFVWSVIKWKINYITWSITIALPKFEVWVLSLLWSVFFKRAMKQLRSGLVFLGHNISVKIKQPLFQILILCNLTQILYKQKCWWCQFRFIQMRYFVNLVIPCNISIIVKVLWSIGSTSGTLPWAMSIRLRRVPRFLPSKKTFKHLHFRRSAILFLPCRWFIGLPLYIW